MTAGTGPAAAAPTLADLDALWWEALGPPETADDLTQGFVSLGGYSLAAARFIAEVDDRFGVQLPILLLLRDNASLVQVREAVAAAPTVPAQRAPRRPAGQPGDTSALAPSQRRLWLLSTLHPESAAYNVVAALRMRGLLDLDVLRAGLADVVSRRDALRASVVAGTDLEPSLRYAADVPVELAVVDGGEALDAEQVTAFVAEVAGRPIPLDGAPLLRAAVLRGADDACLVLSVHHIVADQRSADLILADLEVAYRARLAGNPPAFRAAPTFAGYADAEADAVGSPHWQADLEYWRELLRDPPAERPIPFSRPTGVPSWRGAEHNAALGVDRTARIDAYVREYAVTPAMLFLGCVAVVLAGWLGQDRVVIGMPASRRRGTDDHDLVGFLVETLPILVDVAGSPGVPELLRHIRDRYVAAVAHSAVTFDAIVAALRLPPRPLASPLFNVWFNDLTQGAALPAWPGLAVSAVPTGGFAALFDLNFYLHRDAGGYRLQLVRALDRIGTEPAEEFLAQCVAVLDQLLAGSDARPSSLSLRTGGQVEPAMLAPVRTPAPVSAAVAPAIRTPFGELTHENLDRAVERLAERLRVAGVGPGAVVEIRAHRAGGLPVALLGTWRVGAAAALVDGALPPPRLAEQHEALRPAVVLQVMPETVAEVRLLPGADTPRSLPGASHLLFTTGTGGRAAAVVVPGGALDAALDWYADTFVPMPGDRVGLLAGPGHDPALRDALTPLRCGGTLVVPPADAFANPTALTGFLLDERITVLHATPALLELIAAAAPVRLDALRLVVSAGAPLTAGLVRRLRALTRAAVVNGYGTTETPQLAGCQVVLGYGEPADRLAGWPGGRALADDAVLPLGTGVAGRQLLVLAPNGELAGVGQLGEIVVRGAGLASGYLDGTERDGRFADGQFRTGDLGRLDPSGVVHFAGRADRQVSVDGFRVDPAEIEAVAQRFPGVSQAAAGLLDTPAGPALALNVVAEPGAAVDVAALPGYLGMFLPRHAVPRFVAAVERLATNGNHKVVMTAESLPASARPSASGEVASWLAGLLREVVGREVGPDENFFEAGMTSLNLVRLHARLAAVMAEPPPATVLFANPNLRSLDRYLTNGGTEPGRARQRDAGISDRVAAAAQARRDQRRARRT